MSVFYMIENFRLKTVATRKLQSMHDIWMVIHSSSDPVTADWTETHIWDRLIRNAQLHYDRDELTVTSSILGRRAIHAVVTPEGNFLGDVGFPDAVSFIEVCGPDLTDERTLSIDPVSNEVLPVGASARIVGCRAVRRFGYDSKIKSRSDADLAREILGWPASKQASRDN